MYVAVLGIQDDSRLYVEAWRALSVLKGKTMPFNGNNLLWGFDKEAITGLHYTAE